MTTHEPFPGYAGLRPAGRAALAAVVAFPVAEALVIALLPAPITERPEYLGQVLVAVALIPAVYAAMWRALYLQQRSAEARAQEQAIALAVHALEAQAVQAARAEARAAEVRAGLTAQFAEVRALVHAGDFGAAQALVEASAARLDATRARRWCANPVLNAIIGSYVQQAEAAGIAVDATLVLPAELPYDALELGCVLANALDNAVAAAARAEAPRRIELRCIASPQLMISVGNSCAVLPVIGADGLPVAQRAGHGLGTRSIAAWCEREGAWCRWTAGPNWCELRIVG